MERYIQQGDDTVHHFVVSGTPPATYDQFAEEAPGTIQSLELSARGLKSPTEVSFEGLPGIAVRVQLLLMQGLVGNDARSIVMLDGGTSSGEGFYAQLLECLADAQKPEPTAVAPDPGQNGLYTAHLEGNDGTANAPAPAADGSSV